MVSIIPIVLLCSICFTCLGFGPTADAVAFVQGVVQGDRARASSEWPAAEIYAPVKYLLGESVEGKTKNGSWIPCTIIGHGEEFGLYHLHVSEDYPGYDLPYVPYQLLRRVPGPGEADYLIDNNQLQHRGKGLKYRFSKNLDDAGGEYAPWGTLIVGSDEGDGWLKTDRGYYLPFVIHETPVLLKKQREGPQGMKNTSNIALSGKLVNHATKDALPPMAAFVSGEHSEFRTKAGDWYPCRIMGLGKYLDTYNIVVLPNEYTVYPVSNVPYQNLKKLGPAPTRLEKEGEPPACKKEGCILVRVRTQQGREFLLQISKRSKLDMLMKMVCNKLKIEWASCQAQHRFLHDKEQISPWTHALLSGLQDQDLIMMEDIVAPTEGASA